MFNKVLLLAVASLLLTACANNAPVARKPGTFTAVTIPVFSDLWVDGVVQLASKEKNGCGNFPKNMLPIPTDKDFSTDLTGNQDIFFHLARADAQVECNVYGTFYATRGNVYTLNIDTKNRQCTITLTEKTPAGIQSKIKTYPSYVSLPDRVKVCENKANLY